MNKKEMLELLEELKEKLEDKFTTIEIGWLQLTVDKTITVEEFFDVLNQMSDDDEEEYVCENLDDDDKDYITIEDAIDDSIDYMNNWRKEYHNSFKTNEIFWKHYEKELRNHLLWLM